MLVPRSEKEDVAAESKRVLARDLTKTPRVGTRRPLRITSCITDHGASDKECRVFDWNCSSLQLVVVDKSLVEGVSYVGNEAMTLVKPDASVIHRLLSGVRIHFEHWHWDMDFRI